MEVQGAEILETITPLNTDFGWGFRKIGQISGKRWAGDANKATLA